MNARQAAKLIGERSRSKFGAKPTQYDGIKYHSKREAEYAASLDILKRCGEIKNWDRQIQFVLHADRAPLSPLGKHIVDFRYTDKNGVLHYVEVKGFDTAFGKWKRNHASLEYGIKIEVVK